MTIRYPIKNRLRLSQAGRFFYSNLLPNHFVRDYEEKSVNMIFYDKNER